MIKSILFVCTGNTCRSVMAQAIAKQLFETMDEGLEKIEVMSAGIMAVSGQPASEHAIEVMKERGSDILFHKAQLLSEDNVKKADLILTMTRHHKEILQMMFPSSYGKVFTLKEYAGYDEEDIADPFGGSIEDYRNSADQIRDALVKIAQKLRMLG